MTSAIQLSDRDEAMEPEGLAARVKSLLHGRWIPAITLGLLLGAGAGAGGWFAGQKTYASHGEIYVAPYVDDYGLGDSSDRAALFQNYDALVDTQMQFLKSTRVIDKAMAGDAWRSLGRPYSNKAVADFTRNLSITHKGEIIFVGMRDPDPNAASTGAKTIVEAYQALTAEEDAERGRGKLEFLRSELARVTSDLLSIDAAIKNKMAEQGYGDYSVDDLTTLFASKLSESAAVDRRLSEVRRELAMAGAAQTRPASTRPGDALPLATQPSLASVPPPEEIAVQNAQMAALLSRKSALLERQQMLVSKYGPSHDLVKSADIELEHVNEAIDDFQRSFAIVQLRQQNGLSDPLEHEKLLRLEATLRAASGESKDAVDKVTRLKRDIQELRERAELGRRSRDDITGRLETQERVTRIPGRVRVLEAADKPLEPDSDSRPRMAVAGGIVGLVLGFGFIAMLGLADQRVRGPDDARRIGLLGKRPVLGLLPELPDNVEDHALAARSVHRVRTLLQLWYGNMSRPVFAIAGPASGSGKTTLTLALGLSYAAARSRTLLIDFDFLGGGLTRRVSAIRRRRIGRVLLDLGLLNDVQLQDAVHVAATSGLRLGETLIQLGHLTEAELVAALDRQRENRLGVVDVLEGERLGDCICQTGIENLSILPLGDAGEHHIGSISPLGIQQLIDSARNEYDIVLIDTGPQPGSLEGASAVAAADGVILTVSRGDSRVALRQCERYLDSIGAKLAGVVFNRATPRDFALIAGTSGSSSRSLVSGAESNAIPSELAGRRFGPFGDSVTHASKSGKNVSAR